MFVPARLESPCALNIREICLAWAFARFVADLLRWSGLFQNPAPSRNAFTEMLRAFARLSPIAPRSAIVRPPLVIALR